MKTKKDVEKKGTKTSTLRKRTIDEITSYRPISGEGRRSITPEPTPSCGFNKGWEGDWVDYEPFED